MVGSTPIGAQTKSSEQLFSEKWNAEGEKSEGCERVSDGKAETLFTDYESTRQSPDLDPATLPSPETVAVFGRYLEDQRDLPETPSYPPVQSNWDLAINGLRKLGLRGFPDIGRRSGGPATFRMLTNPNLSKPPPGKSLFPT